MKYSLCFILCFITLQSPAQPTQKDIVTIVRAKVNAINVHTSEYKKVEKETTEESATAFFHNNSIVKINATFYKETGKSVVEYYYESDKPLFIYEKDINYYKPVSAAPPSIKSTQENRLYYENGMLMKWIDDRHKEMPTGTKSFETASLVWTRDAEKQLELFTSIK